MLGTRYKSYCSNIVRTVLVEPTADMQANYDLLLRVEEDILNKLQHGMCGCVCGCGCVGLMCVCVYTGGDCAILCLTYLSSVQH